LVTDTSSSSATTVGVITSLTSNISGTIFSY
jgi:hypothetical protein